MVFRSARVSRAHERDGEDDPSVLYRGYLPITDSAMGRRGMCSNSPVRHREQLADARQQLGHRKGRCRVADVGRASLTAVAEA